MNKPRNLRGLGDRLERLTSSPIKTGDGSSKKRDMISVNKEETKNGCFYCH